MIKILGQTNYFNHCYGSKISLTDRKFLQALISVKKRHLVKKLMVIKKYKFRRNSFLGSLYLLAWLLK